MSAFTSPLIVEFSNAKDRKVKLLEELIWEFDEIGSQRFVTVPIGFSSDGMTIPRFLWWWIPPLGHQSTRPSILHDYLIFLWKSGKIDYSKKFIDKQLYIAMRACGVSKVTSSICYYSVRLYSLIRYGE